MPLDGIQTTEDKIVTLLQKMTEALTGEAPVGNSSFRYAYVASGSETIVTNLISSPPYNIGNYDSHASLQTGVSEIAFSCNDEQFGMLVAEVLQKHLAIYLTTKRLSITSSIGSVSVSVSSGNARTPTNTNPSINGTSATILASNTSRKGFLIQNPSGVSVYIDESGGTATSNNFELLPNGVLERSLELGNMTTGLLTAITSDGSTISLKVVEYT